MLANQLSTPEANRQKDLARVGRAACQTQLGQASEGIAAIEEVIQKSDPKDSELLAEAYNALGTATGS